MNKVNMDTILNRAWKTFSKNMVPLVIGYIVAFIIPLIILGPLFFSMFFFPVTTSKPGLGLGFDWVISLFVFGIIAVLVYPPFQYGYIYFANSLRKNRNTRIEVIFEGVKKFFLRGIVQSILWGLIIGGLTLIISLPLIISSFLPSMGSGTGSLFGFVVLDVVLILVGIFLVSFVLMYWPYVIVIEDMGVFQGLSRAYRVWDKNKSISFVVLLITWILGGVAAALGYLAALAALFIGPLITVLMIETYYAIRK